MSDKYVISGTTNPSTNGTSEVVLEKDDQGQPSKVISTNQAAELTKADKDLLEGLGVKVQKVTADEAAELETEAAQEVGSDSAAAGPVLGSGGSGGSSGSSGSGGSGSTSGSSESPKK